MDVTNTTQVDSITLGNTLEGKQFSVNADAAFFDILSNSLYQDPCLAVIRETITNAVDAHKEANVNEPIEVNYDLGTGILTVADKGNGIPHEKIHEIYCVYGNSTKKDNDSTGGFGLGCKAPFAVTDSFTITNSHKGVEKTYILAKNNGIPEIISIKEEKQNNQSGLTVTIPFKKHFELLQPIVIIFSYYAGLNIKFNGELLTKVNYSDTDVHYVFDKKVNNYSLEDILGMSSKNLKGIYIKYGANIYFADIFKKDSPLYQLATKWNNSWQFACFSSLNKFNWTVLNILKPIMTVPANSIDITPNRESIRYTDRTISTITKILTEEVNRLTVPINFNDWDEAYTNDRFNLFLNINGGVLDKLENNHCITAPEILKGMFNGIQTYNRETDAYLGYNYAKSILSTIRDNSKDYPFKDFVSALLTYEEASLNIAKYKNASNLDNEHLKVLQNVLWLSGSSLEEKTIKFNEPLYKILSSNKLKYFYIGGVQYPVDDPQTGITRQLCRYTVQNNSLVNFYMRLFKVVVLSPYCVDNANSLSKISNLFNDKYPDLSFKRFYTCVYNVQVKSKEKATKIAKSLEDEDYIVINLTGDSETNSSTSKSPKTLELVNNLKDKDKAYYITKAFSSFTPNYPLSLNELLLEFSCSRNYGYFKSTLDKLNRYNNYERIEMNNNVKAIELLKKCNIKSVQEVIAQDIKEMLEKDSNLCDAFSLLYYTKYLTNRNGFMSDFTKTVWFVLQMPDLCSRYKLPLVNKDTLTDICFISKFRDNNPEYFEVYKDLIINNSKANKFAEKIQIYNNFTRDWQYVMSFINKSLDNIQGSKIEDIPPEIGNLVLTLLDAIFKDEEVTSNE